MTKQEVDICFEAGLDTILAARIADDPEMWQRKVHRLAVMNRRHLYAGIDVEILKEMTQDEKDALCIRCLQGLDANTIRKQEKK
jgi:hypothetical protein